MKPFFILIIALMISGCTFTEGSVPVCKGEQAESAASFVLNCIELSPGIGDVDPSSTHYEYQSTVETCGEVAVELFCPLQKPTEELR